MTQTVLLKRSSIPAKVPTTADLALGEIGINTYDGKVYIKKDDGTESIIQLGSGGGVGGTYTQVNSSFTATANTAYLVDTAVNPITVTLPASPAVNDTIILVDYNQNSQTNNITVARNGNQINKLAEDLIIDYNGISVTLTYYSGNWVITDTGGINNAGYIQTTEFVATAGQANFAVTYPTSSALLVFVNGVQLSLAAGDYTAGTGTNVVLAVPLVAGDLVKFITFNNIGNYPTVNSSEYTAAANQTTFSFTYNAAAGISGLQVFKNGIQLSSSQYTAANGTSVILATPCSVNDKIRLMSIQAATTGGSGSGLGGGNLIWTFNASSFSADVNAAYAITATAPVTVTLPASPSNYDRIRLLDYGQNSNTYNITVARNGNNIEGSANDLTINVAGVSIELTFITGQGWIISDTGNALGGTNPWASPALSGTATAPTPTTGDSSTLIATTAFVQNTLASGIYGGTY